MSDPDFRLGEDGEIEYQYDSAADDFKPKGKPRRYRTVQLPLRVVVPLVAILLCSAVFGLVVNYQFALCDFRVLCFSEGNYWMLPINYVPALPFNEARIIRSSSYDSINDIRTTAVYTVTPASYTQPACDTIAETGKEMIIFDSGDGDNAELFMLHSDGTGLCRLTTNLIEENNPQVSPDGQQILFNSNRADAFESDLFVLNINTGVISNVTNSLNRSDVGGRWSPDGKQIAFEALADRLWDHQDIFVINADGSGRRSLLPDKNSSWDSSPVWSPDGKQIAFISDQLMDGKHDLYLMNADGSNVRAMNVAAPPVYGPTWLPDGEQIMLFNEQGRWLFNLADMSTQQLPSTGWKRHFLSPDGSQFVYISEGDLYIQDVDRPDLFNRLTYGLDISAIAGWR